MFLLSKQLIEAAHASDLEAIRILHAQGSSLNGFDEERVDLLSHWIWQCCDDQKLRELLDLGCRPANENTKGLTPLVASIWCKNPVAVRMLLDAGANPNTLAFVEDDVVSALDTVIDDYFECNPKELEDMIAIERMIRLAGGRVYSKTLGGGNFPNWNYETQSEGDPFKNKHDA